jgi:hypothetical protein
MQESARCVFPTLIILGIFVAGGLHSLISPYMVCTFPWGSIRPDDQSDTTAYAVLRFFVGGAFWIFITIRWWLRTIKSD